MEDNKYYTPSIEEFYIGFEYEQLNIQTRNWYKTVVEDNEHLLYLLFDSNDKTFVKDISNVIRVKYLDKEDIESLGFDEDYDDMEGNTWYRYHISDQIRLCFLEGLNFNIEICDDQLTTLNDTIFKGNIKNKSELKKLLIQLGIC